MRLSDIRVATKVGGGFAVVLALLLIVGTVGFNGLNDADRNFQEYRRLARKTNAIGIAEDHLIRMRVAVRTFVDFGTEEEYARAVDYAGKTGGDIREMIAELQDQTEIQRIETMGRQVSAYLATFEQVAEFRRSEDLIMEKTLNVRGAEAEHALTTMMDSASRDGDAEGAFRSGLVLRDLLLGRLYVQKYLTHANDAFHQRASDELAAATKGAVDLTTHFSSGARHDLALQAKSGAETYAGAYGTLHATHEKRENLIKTDLEPIGPQISQAIEDFKQQNKAQQDTLGPQASAAVHSAHNIMITVSVAALLLGIAGATLIARSLTIPIRRMTATMRTLANGNLTIEIPATGDKDEIGDMARAVQVFKDNALEMERLRRDQEEQKRQAEVERHATMNRLAETFENSVGKVIGTLTSAATELQAAAAQMANAASETSGQATTVAASAQQASANVQTVATASEQLAASIGEIARQMERSQTVSTRATAEADITSRLMHTLSDSVTTIGEIVNMITDIASQTNLLALNATIESARAGDAGKGFAVVAGEVKHLAGQTAKATEDIARQIATVQKRTSDAVGAIGSISQVIAEIREISGSVASAVQQQTAATGEIARNVEQAATGTAAVTSNIVTVEQAARESGQAAAQIRESSLDLSRQAEFLTQEVSRFLLQVRNDGGATPLPASAVAFG